MEVQSLTIPQTNLVNAGNATQQARESQSPETTRGVERREPPPEQRVEKSEEPARPVVNAQGQQTGTLINVTA